MLLMLLLLWVKSGDAVANERRLVGGGRRDAVVAGRDCGVVGEAGRAGAKGRDRRFEE